MSRKRRSERPEGTSVHGMQIRRGSENVFVDLALPNPEEHLVKARLAQIIGISIADSRLKKREVGLRMGINPDELVAITRGKFKALSIDRLIYLVKAYEYHVDINVRKAERTQAAIRIIFDGPAEGARSGLRRGIIQPKQTSRRLPTEPG